MSDMFHVPNIRNIYYNKPRNFTLVIYAYRKLPKSEIMNIVNSFMSDNGFLVLPRGKTFEIMYYRE